jgi:hypothetical protein
LLASTTVHEKAMLVVGPLQTRIKGLLASTTVHEKAMLVVGPLQTRIKGLPDHIDASRPPKNFRDAM